ncbi:MAG TPA: phosphoglucosamine mutase [Nitrososphaeraceae archaeon]|nr:phosphoglucosamine mutase [Nitrososphaeraceae archaeon]
MTIKSEENELNGPPRLFGTNGVRGIYGRELTIPLVIDLTYSLATYFQSGSIVVGFDGRHSSPLLSNIVSAVLNAGGLDVLMAGQIPTPCLQFVAKTKKLSGGIMITASHNPPEYNGIKPCSADGVEISRKDELRVEKIYYNRQFSKVDQTSKTFYDQNIITEYLDSVLSLINVEKIKSRSFKVVMDLGNGVQTLVAPYLLKKLGCQVVTINSNIDGDFPGRGPEPSVDNLTTLSNMVRDLHADLGVAYDGDGDRSIFCDEKGIIHPGDKTAAVLVKYLINWKHKGAEIICPINTTLNVQLVADEGNSNVVYTKVGSVEVSREMIKRKALIGLEENGGFMYGKLNQVRDGAMTTGLILDMLVNFSLTNKSTNQFSEIMTSLKKIAQFKTKFKCPSKDVANKIVTKCIEHGSPKKIETLDGAKMWIDDESWIMVRPSGTEPLVRMYGESISQTLLDSKVREYTRIIESLL